MFLGEYLHTFDPKNRISLPSKFRKGLGRAIVMTRGLDHCVYVYARKVWEREAAKYADKANGGEGDRKLARLFLAGSFEVEVDAVGRILVPDNLKQFAHLGDKAIIAGVLDRVEVWDEKAWKGYSESIEREAATLGGK